jgi:uncharacterized membrane-anchored protein YitT (DUF2179 family)
MKRKQRPRAPRPRRDRRALARQVRQVALDYLTIIVGGMLVGAAADLFLIPNRLVPAGVAGISTMLHYLVGTPVGLVTFLINVPLFLAGIKWAGGLRWGLRTIVGVAAMSATIDLLAPHVPQITSDPLLYTLYGGLLDGLGVGLVFRAGGTTGGVDIIARLVHHFWGVKLGHTLLATAVLVLGLAALIFGVQPALYALLVAYVSSRVVDLVQEGLSQSRAAFIISQQPEAIKTAILSHLGRGVTILQGAGGYTAQPRPVLLCAVAQSEVSRLKRLIHELDPEAFVILFNASEVLGQGFKGLASH